MARITRPTVRAARIARWAAVPAALAVSGLLVAQASYSAYSDTTATPANNWSTGTVKLVDDDNNGALFSATNLKPGQSGSKCIAVTSSGSLASAVKLYGTAAATTNNLAANINLTVTQGTGGSFGSCTGFTAAGNAIYSGTVAGFGTAYTGYSNGLATWSPTGASSETKVFKFDYSVKDTAPDSTQGGTAALTFTWEAQNS